ncbi:hypothetical protein PENARI_c003G08796 [Penicillium arizonense]|uniref:Arrestin-like N-terminal domain-containing protein n=1 Tax=Penicillium arizonense TaxID=1835702 RepID=A0A1F5LSC3_PENAI|nr:hypothetical protein PENARI_c003G08796 [Penicillium arizonense]OGE56027.1 hypothetical protein PENARI_c003G08796 [Penicillium arizonense]
MDSFNLELVAPSTHHISSLRGEKGELATLSGHAIISADSNLSFLPCQSVHVRLIQTVKSAYDKSCCMKATNRRFSFEKTRLFCPSFLSPTANPSQATRTDEQAVEIASLPCSLEGTPKEHSGRIIAKYYFSLEVPTIIPTTTETPLGSVTYKLIASATAADHEPATKSQSVKLCRQAASQTSPLIRTALEFPLSKLIQGMTLTQQPTLRSEPTLSFTATISPRWQTYPGQRTTEIKHLVVRELRWYAEEIVKVMSQPADGSSNNYSICKSEKVRKLCKGNVKGYWGSDQNPYVKQPTTITQDGDKHVLIPIQFAIRYPKHAAVIDDLDLESYEFGAADDVCPPPYSPTDQGFHMEAKRAIIVQHQLKFEIITGEDTFAINTEKLVERKPLRTTVCPAFPFTVCGCLDSQQRQ